MAGYVDIDKELADAPIGPLHKQLGVLVTLITLFDGYDTFNPAYVIHYVMKPWGLAPSQAGLLISSGLLGFLIGAAAQGVIADRLGRRGALVASLWVVNIFTLATAFYGDGFYAFCILRILTGIGLGALLPLATTFINELAPPRISNAFSLWGVTLGWSLGGVLAGLVGLYLTPTYGWTILYWMGGFSIPLTLVVVRVLPESPRFLARHGRIEEAGALLKRLRPDREAFYRASVLVAEPTQRIVNPVAELLSPRYRGVSLRLWLAGFLSLFSIYGLTGWIPTVMMKRGETFAASFGFGAIMLGMSFVGGLVLAMLSDRLKGRSSKLLALWWGVGGFAVLGLLAAQDHWANLACIAAAGFLIVGAQHVMNNFTAASYDTAMRASGVGMMLSVGRVGAILGPYIAGLLQGFTGGPESMFWTIGIGALIAGLSVATIGAPRKFLAEAGAVHG